MRTYTPRDSVAVEYAGLGDGETKAGQICPACTGGQTHEGSLSVTRRGGSLLFNCHRAACPFHGAIDLVGRSGAWAREAEPRPCRAVIPTYELDEESLALLAAEHFIPTEVLRRAELSWTGDGDGRYGRRVCYPIYGPDAKERGKSYRSYIPEVNPKAIIQLNDVDQVSSCWYKWQRKAKSLVIVEDQMSAIKIAPHTHSLALLGVNLSEAKIEEIVAGGYEQVCLSLDNDATGEAIRLQLKYRSKIKGLQIHGLEKDIKNMNEDELNVYLSRVL